MVIMVIVVIRVASVKSMLTLTSSSNIYFCDCQIMKYKEIEN